MRFLIASILFICLNVGATTFTEFYVQTTGGNTNSGHTADDAATFNAVSGNWTNSTLKYFKSGLNPVTGGVTNGAWAAIFLTAFPTNAQYDAIVTAADDTADTITLSSAAFMGTNPGNNVGGMSIRVGGAWKGPTTNTMVNGGGFPFNFLSNTATNGSQFSPRANFKGGTTYLISNAITHANSGPMRFQGYTSNPGDGGKATIDGGPTGTSYILLTISGVNNDFVDMIFANNGNSGSASGVSSTAAENNFIRCVVHDIYGSGIGLNAANSLIESEVYSCNKGNAANGGGAASTSDNVLLLRCVIHDNAGGNTSGVRCANPIRIIGCIFDTNGKDGVTVSATAGAVFLQDDFYNNASSGIDIATASAIPCYVENCNFVKNGAFGVTSSGSSLRNGEVINCWFGTGTMTNSSGSFAANLGGLFVNATNLYVADVTPWTDPANGDFRINLVAAKAVGRGSFTETAASYAGTIGYPDIGAAQSASTNAQKSFTFSQ